MRLVLPGWSEDGGAEIGHGGRELVAGVALVAEDRLAACERARQQGQGDLPLGPVSGDERGRARRAVRGAGQV